MKKGNKQSALKTPPILFSKTQKIIKEIKQDIGGDFISYWISENGHLVQEDVVIFEKLLSSRKKQEVLYLFIKSDGGSGKGALRIIHLLRNYYETIIALVPLDCASAATMLALGADTIKMGPIAYLTAIDTSITHDMSPIDEKYNDKVSVSQNELDRVIRLWDSKSTDYKNTNPYAKLYKYIHPLVFGAVDRASSLSIKLTKEILSYHMDNEEEAERISQHLNAEYPSHSYPITLNEAQKIGLKIETLSDKLNVHLLELNALYSEMAQRAYTDYDEENYHDNEILKVIEMQKTQCFYQKDKDYFYRKEERRYIPLNDDSGWRMINSKKGKEKIEKYYIS